jgi:hypothetical protein
MSSGTFQVKEPELEMPAVKSGLVKSFCGRFDNQNVQAMATPLFRLLLAPLLR